MDSWGPAFQVSESLSLDGIVLLVLEEDGTGVDTEEFFQTLPENTVLMFLEKGQKWTPSSVSVSTSPTRWRSSVASLQGSLPHVHILNHSFSRSSDIERGCFIKSVLLYSSVQNEP